MIKKTRINTPCPEITGSNLKDYPKAPWKRVYTAKLDPRQATFLRTQQLSVLDWIRAIRGSAGIKTVIATRLGCDIHTVINHLKSDAMLRQLYNDEFENTGDWLESKLLQKVNEGSASSLHFALRTKYRNKGYGNHPMSEYGEGQEHTDAQLLKYHTSEKVIDVSPNNSQEVLDILKLSGVDVKLLEAGKPDTSVSSALARVKDKVEVK